MIKFYLGIRKLLFEGCVELLKLDTFDFMIKAIIRKFKVLCNLLELQTVFDCQEIVMGFK